MWVFTFPLQSVPDEREDDGQIGENTKDTGLGDEATSHYKLSLLLREKGRRELGVCMLV